MQPTQEQQIEDMTPWGIARLPVTSRASALTVGAARGKVDACACVSAVSGNLFDDDEDDEEEDDEEEDDGPDPREVARELRVSLGMDGDVMTLHNLYVRPMHRDKGVPQRFKRAFCSAYVEAFKNTLREQIERLESK